MSDQSGNNNSSAPAAANTAVQTPVSPTTETPKQAEVRKMKLRVNDADIELPESEVIGLAQKGKSADSKFQEAAKLRREAEETVAYLKSNPREALAKLGIDVRQFSEEYLMEVLTEASMTPEQKKSQQDEKELRSYREQEKAKKEAAHAEEMRIAEETQTKAYNEMFIKALSESGLPKNQFTVKRMAELQLTCLKKGYELAPEQLAKLVREDYIAEQKALFGASEGDQLMELLGQDIVKKLSNAQIAKLKAAPIKHSQPVVKREESSNRSPKTNHLKELAKKNGRRW